MFSDVRLSATPSDKTCTTFISALSTLTVNHLSTVNAASTLSVQQPKSRDQADLGSFAFFLITFSLCTQLGL
jgi:hypothetical protein